MEMIISPLPPSTEGHGDDHFSLSLHLQRAMETIISPLPHCTFDVTQLTAEQLSSPPPRKRKTLFKIRMIFMAFREG
jgi:uncharacterized membrane protein